MEVSPKNNINRKNLLVSVHRLKELIKTAENVLTKGEHEDNQSVSNSVNDKCSLMMNKSCSSNFHSASTNLNESLFSNSFNDLLEEGSHQGNHSDRSENSDKLHHCMNKNEANFCNKSLQISSSPGNAKNLQHLQELQMLNQKIKTDKLISCLNRKRKKKTKKVVWKRIEEIRLLELVEQYGKNWERISLFFPDRSAEQIKEKYLTKLNPQLKSSKFTQEEDEEILNLHEKYGNKWNIIAKHFLDRSATMIKNRFYSSLKNRIKSCISEDEAERIENQEKSCESYKIQIIENVEENPNNRNVHDLNFNFDIFSDNQPKEDISSLLFHDLDSSSLYNFNDGLYGLSCYHTNINSISSYNNKRYKNNSNISTNSEYLNIFNKYENLQIILNSLDSIDENKNLLNFERDDITYSDNLSKITPESSIKIEKLKVDLRSEINRLRKYRDENDLIPKENLLQIIDLMIELIKIIKKSIQ